MNETHLNLKKKYGSFGNYARSICEGVGAIASN